MNGYNFLDWMPEQGTDWASRVDWINNFISWTAFFCTFVITGLMLYFAWKYRKKSENQKTAYITHNNLLEIVWTTIPTLVCIFVGFHGYKVYHEMRTPPANALEISVTGQKWSWSYKYPNGKTTDKDLVVPVGQPVRLVMKSKDVSHSFFLPIMRVKEDVIASEYHYMWFTPTKIGNSHIFCAEYCGLDHSAMTGTLKVVSQEEYEDFVNDRKAEELSPEELGKKIYQAKACVSCHSLDGNIGIGPSLKGIFGKTEVMADGSSVVVDENYIRESILYSNKKIVQGFAPNLMPSFDAQLKDEEIAGLIAFIKSIK